MKMKKALSLVLAASLALTSLAACGGGSDEEQASNSDTFKIGGIGPTTGDAAAYGTAVQNGAQLAVDEINEAGGIRANRSSSSSRMTRTTLRNPSTRTTL